MTNCGFTMKNDVVTMNNCGFTMKTGGFAQFQKHVGCVFSEFYHERWRFEQKWGIKHYRKWNLPWGKHTDGQAMVFVGNNLQMADLP